MKSHIWRSQQRFDIVVTQRSRFKRRLQKSIPEKTEISLPNWIWRQDIHVNPRKENLNIPDWISNLKYRAILWATCKPCKSIIARHCGRVVHPGRAGSVTNGRLIATPLFVYNNNGMVNQTLFAYLGYFGGRGIYD